MSGPPAADLIAHFLQRRFRNRPRGDAQAWREARSLGSLDVVLRLALGLPVDFRDPSLRGPGAAAALERDALSCIVQCFFRDDATHYDILGLSPDASPEVVREHFGLLMRLIHPDRQGAGTVWPETFAARANGAYAVLKVPEARAAYDAELAAARFREQAVHRAGSMRGRSPAVGPAQGHRRRAVPTAALPEWLTLDVGGFVREHPVVSSMVAIVVGSASIIAALAWEGRVATLTRETRTPAVEKAPPTAVARAADSETAISDAARPDAPALAVTTSPSTVVIAAPTSAAATASSGKPSVQPLPTTAPPTKALASASAADASRTVSVAVPAKREALAPPIPEAAPPVAAGIDAGRTAGATPMANASPPRVAGVPERVSAVPDGPSAAAEAAPVAATRPAAFPSGRASAPENPERRAPVVAAVAVATPPAATVAAPPAATVAAPPAATVAAPASATVAAAEPGATTALPPATAEIEALFAAFVESYEKGRLDALAALFDDDAEMNLRRGRPAIRGEYDELFRLSSSRRMQLTRINWRRTGDRAHAKGEILVRIGWRDGREVEQRIAVDMELVRRDGRALIAKLSQQPRN